MYYKITNERERHNGYQYQDGLNILLDRFNDNQNESCVPGGFYFTTLEHIEVFFGYGIFLREIELPVTDPEFKMVKDPNGHQLRANRIILGKKYSLLEPTTYIIFGLKIDYYLHRIIQNAIHTNRVDIMESLEKMCPDKICFLEYFFEKCCKYGAFNLAKWFYDFGKRTGKPINIHSDNDYSFFISCANGYLDLARWLWQVGQDMNEPINLSPYQTKNYHNQHPTVSDWLKTKN